MNISILLASQPLYTPSVPTRQSIYASINYHICVNSFEWTSVFCSKPEGGDGCWTCNTHFAPARQCSLFHLLSITLFQGAYFPSKMLFISFSLNNSCSGVHIFLPTYSQFQKSQSNILCLNYSCSGVHIFPCTSSLFQLQLGHYFRNLNSYSKISGVFNIPWMLSSLSISNLWWTSRLCSSFYTNNYFHIR